MSNWNPSDKAAAITLSNSDRTASTTTPGQWVAVRGTTSKTTGKWYFEIIIDAIAVNNNMGVCDLGPVLDAFDFAAINVGIDAGGGTNKSANISFDGSPHSFSVGTIIGFAVDCDAPTVATYANNVANGTFSGSGLASPNGGYYPLCALNGTGTATDTLRTAAADQTYAPPSGFSAWDEGIILPVDPIWFGSSL